MMHMPQIRSGIQSDGTRNYESFFERIKPYIEYTDIAIANLETTISTKGPYSGFPRFRSPAEILDALQEAGFNVLITANNHSFDNKEIGVYTTLNEMEKRNMASVGTSRTAEEQKPYILEKNGVKIGLAAYTYGTNGIPLPSDRPFLVNLIDSEQIHKDMLYLDLYEVDFKIVAMHFGNEYHRSPSEYQKEQVLFLNSLGVDVVIGSHPHVLQPVTSVIGENGNRTLVAYSLGNFISNQKDPHTDSGLIFQFTLTKNFTTGETNVQQDKNIPTAVVRYWENGKRSYRVIALSDLLNDPTLLNSSGKSEDYYQSMWTETLEMMEHESVDGSTF
jgi:poly-gamma-glutamate capsule biosynthesis protein CapA/YwtB (metallophosphatase superfamily)